METTVVKPQKSSAGKRVGAILLTLIVLIGSAVGTYLYTQDQKVLTTDNVKVTADLHSIAPMGAGKLRKLMVATGDVVTKDQIVGLVENGGYLRSPIDGEIVACNATQDQLVSPSQAVCVVADTSDIYIEANIEETDIRKIHQGQAVSIKLDAFPGQAFSGVVRETDSITQSALAGNRTSFSTSGTYTKVTQLIPVKIDVKSTVDLDKLIGTNATVTITLD